jgi:predicted nucleic acid-binding protein
VIIVDASVVVKWFAIEPLHEQARALLLHDDELLAPDIVAVEVANALWVKIGPGEISGKDASRAIAAVVGGGQPELRSAAPLVPRALELAQQLHHPVYDCVYLALAEETDATLVTADHRFRTAAASLADDRVRVLGS